MRAFCERKTGQARRASVPSIFHVATRKKSTNHHRCTVHKLVFVYTLAHLVNTTLSDVNDTHHTTQNQYNNFPAVTPWVSNLFFEMREHDRAWQPIGDNLSLRALSGAFGSMLLHIAGCRNVKFNFFNDQASWHHQSWRIERRSSSNDFCARLYLKIFFAGITVDISCTTATMTIVSL